MDAVTNAGLRTKCPCKLYPYDYKPLPTQNHIRLLKLCGRHDDSNIHATMGSYDINELPVYTAVSYRWRPSYPLRAIHINGMRFWARTNLLALLRQLIKLEGSQLLWIDAISINQFDVEERNSQVRMMGSIYSKASLVLSWLDSITESELQMASSLLSKPNNWLYLDFGKPQNPSSEFGWDAVRKIMDHEYWTRTWIVQEVVGAEQSFVQCESQRMSMTVLEDFARWFMLRNSQLDSKSLGSTWHLARANCLHLCDHRAKARMSSHPRQPLEHNLLRYSNFDCSEPRDRIYAMLDISIQLDIPIAVNYSCTFAHLFVEVLYCLYECQVMGPQEVVGTAYLLYQQLLCEYGSSSNRLNAIKEEQSSMTMAIQPYFRGLVSTNISKRDTQRFEGFRQNCPAMRTSSTGRAALSYKAEWELWEGIRDSSHVQPTQAQNLFLFAIQRDKPSHLGLTSTPTTLFGFSSLPVETGDEVWQFSNTDFALILRAQVQSGAGSARVMIVGPAQLFDGSGKMSGWNPFLAATDISNLTWDMPLFKEYPRRGKINVLDLVKLVLLVSEF